MVGIFPKPIEHCACDRHGRCKLNPDMETANDAEWLPASEQASALSGLLIRSSLAPLSSWRFGVKPVPQCLLPLSGKVCTTNAGTKHLLLIWLFQQTTSGCGTWNAKSARAWGLLKQPDKQKTPSKGKTTVVLGGKLASETRMFSDAGLNTLPN